MSAQALALVLLAGLIHAGWNIMAKKTGGDARFAFFTSVWMFIVWAPLGLWLGWGAVPAWGAAEWAVVGVSAVLHVVYFVTLLRGYRAADLTVVYPLARGTGPLLSSIGAVLLLGEAVTLPGVLGVLGVVLGVVLIAGARGCGAPPLRPQHGCNCTAA
jgi:drug/metabolite transporter (DMT)-like permease